MDRVFTGLFATYANIRTPLRSTGPHGSDFAAAEDAPLPPFAEASGGKPLLSDSFSEAKGVLRSSHT